MILIKLQYRYVGIGLQYLIRLYCNGWVTKSYKVYADEIDDELARLESEGYSHGYTPEEVNVAREEYEIKLKNIIQKEGQHD